MSKVRDLIVEAGLGPWTTFPAWGSLADLASAVEGTIILPLRAALFAVEAVIDLSKIIPSSIEGMDFSDEIDQALDTRPTPCGSTELWGSALQGIGFNN